ncbi:hypothetical protein E4U25_001452 [Claviceps purpurea]|nr:hypothetical protein E4U25_001452 [Claviceps purpurea]
MDHYTRTRKHYRSFVRTIAKDCNDEAFCDLEIVCGERRFPAHRNVVCLHSSVIRAACLGPWKEADCGVFEIKETSHTLVRRMIDYIYSGDYDDFDSTILVQKDNLSPQEVAEFDIADYLTLHINMMELGDMYMVEGLSELTSEKFAKHLVSQTARDILVIVIPRVYALKIDSSDTIRHVVIESMKKKLCQLPLADDVEESLKDVAENIPEFTRGLIKSYMVALMMLGGNFGFEDSKSSQESEDFEGACGVFEIKESSDALVRRMLDYIYTGNYDDLPSKGPTQDGKRSSTKVAKLGSAPHVLLHAKMMELGDMYLVDGLGLFANERFGILLKSETTRNILVDIIPEVYAMEIKSCKLIRKTLIDLMRRRLAHRPLLAEVEGSWENATRDVPEFTRDLFKSFKDMPVLGHCRNCGGNAKTVPVAPLQLKCLLCDRGGASDLCLWD